MIGLVHGRLLTAPPPGGIIAAPVYQTLAGSASGPTSATAAAAFTLNPNGTWGGTATGMVDKSGNWYSPTTVGAGAAYEVRFTPVLAPGSSAAVINNQAAGWVAASAARSITATTQRFTSGNTESSYTVTVEIRLTGGAIVSTGTFTLYTQAIVGSSEGGGCPAVDMWLGAGLQAGEAQEGQQIDGVTEDDPEHKVRLRILRESVSRQPCHRLVTINGAACVLSDSTPFNLRDGGTAYAPHMLGQEVLRDDGAGGLTWDTVVACYPVGELDVIKIGVGGHSLLAGEHPSNRIVSHNTMKV